MSELTVYSDEELQAIQNIERKALKVLLEVCDHLSIPCFLIDGAALGAVRHGGFIPWDDDLDVGMLRSDYRRFLEAAPAALPSGYTLQTPYSDAACPYFYSKLRVDGTVFMEYPNRKLNIHHGVYIDICPFDSVPDDEKLNERQFKRCQRLIRLFVLKQSPDLSAPPDTFKRKALGIMRRGLHLALKLVPGRVIADSLERETIRYEGTDTKAVAFLHYPGRKVDYMLREELLPLSEGVFDGIKVPLPANPDAYLRRHYGDYMRFPPPERRYGHKPWRVEV